MAAEQRHELFDVVRPYAMDLQRDAELLDEPPHVGVLAAKLKRHERLALALLRVGGQKAGFFVAHVGLELPAEVVPDGVAFVPVAALSPVRKVGTASVEARVLAAQRLARVGVLGVRSAHAGPSFMDRAKRVGRPPPSVWQAPTREHRKRATQGLRGDADSARGTGGEAAPRRPLARRHEAWR